MVVTIVEVHVKPENVEQFIGATIENTRVPSENGRICASMFCSRPRTQLFPALRSLQLGRGGCSAQEHPSLLEVERHGRAVDGRAQKGSAVPGDLSVRLVGAAWSSSLLTSTEPLGWFSGQAESENSVRSQPLTGRRCWWSRLGLS